MAGGNDTLKGGRGDDTLIGGRGSDVYQFGRRDGEDTIWSDGNTAEDVDTLEFGEGISLQDLVFKQEDQHMKVSLRDNGGSVTVKNYYVPGTNTISQIKLRDRTTLDRDAIAGLVNSMAAFKLSNQSDGDGDGQVPGDLSAILNKSLTLPAI